MPSPVPHLKPGLRARALRCAWAVALLVGADGWAAGLAIGTTASPMALSVHVAQAQGFFAAEGVQVQVRRCATGPLCMDDLFSRSLQLVAVTDLPLVSASFKRADFAVVATIATSNSNIRVTARRSAGITGPQQLAGKRIGVLAGTGAQYYLDVYLHFHGVDPQQIKLVPLAPEAIPAAFVDGQIDALVAFQRQTPLVLAALGDDGILLPDPRIFTDTYNLVADRQTLQRRGGDIAGVLRALQRAGDFIAKNPQQAKRILVSHAQLPAEAAEAIFPSITYRLGLEQSLVGTLERMARWARRSGQLAGSGSIPDYRGFVDSGPLTLAVPGALPK